MSALKIRFAPRDAHKMSPEEFENLVKELFAVFPQSSGTKCEPDREPDYESDKYNFEVYRHRGLALLFNIEEFDDDPDSKRKGSEEDKYALAGAFKKLGFHVMVFTNLKALQIKQASEYAAKLFDHEKAACFVCVLMSHGDFDVAGERDGVEVKSHFTLGRDNFGIPTHEIVDLFDNTNCPSLQFKPRLFFIQACHGKGTDDGRKLPDVSPEGSTENPGTNTDNPEPCFSDLFSRLSLKKKKVLKSLSIHPVPLYLDCLIMYGSPPDYISFLRETGSWFLQELCNFLKSPEIETTSFLRGLTSVCRKVAFGYKGEHTDKNSPILNKKQMPVINSMLTKDIFMTKTE